ncbi:MAG: Hpt domain-containing protein [Bacteroidales bacterium]|nr:Hpt domain-containing protein [Bacteroidales bacterium]
MEKPVYSLDNFKEMMGDDADEMVVMVRMFIDLTPTLLSEMQEAVEMQQWRKTGDLAHKIKSSLRLFGMSSLVDIAVEIEHDGRKNNNVEKLAQKVTYFSAQVNLAIQSLKTELNL